jgi:Arc/MetJ-type ribon-helix-helix transcriptional regulator
LATVFIIIFSISAICNQCSVVDLINEDIDMHSYVDYNNYKNSYYNKEKVLMKTVQMTLNEDLITEVDRVVKKLGTTRSAFTRNALQAALDKIWEKEMEHKHQEGYIHKPVKYGEFSDWENEQVWID